jgi:acyl dehydratase
MSKVEATWPRPLVTVKGPYPPTKVEGASAGMGTAGPATVALYRSGLLAPDMMSGLTLYLIARQPHAYKSVSKSGEKKSTGKNPTEKKGAPGVSGGIWVREQAVYHRPILATDEFSIEGANTGRQLRKGRHYSTTESVTYDSTGRRASTNRTTGLISYHVDETLEDGVEGQSLENMSEPSADWTRAAENPHLSELDEARVGDVLGGEKIVVSLEMMVARDTDNPDNPIHSDPQSAIAAGLKNPIAGGSHVQAFALELLMARWGSEVLLHGAYVDCGWKMPTEAGDAITPRAEVVDVRPDRVELAFHYALDSCPHGVLNRAFL